MNNSTILDLLIYLMKINLLNIMEIVNENYSISNEFLCLQFLDFNVIPTENKNNSLLSMNFKMMIISNNKSSSISKKCTNYFLRSNSSQGQHSGTTKLHSFSNSDANPNITGLNVKQIIMICLCSLILGGVALAAAALRLRYYCKRRRIQTKDESYGYSFGSRCSFSEIGLDKERRLNVSRSVNYQTLEIYPNYFYQTVQCMDAHHAVAAVNTHYTDGTRGKPVYSIAFKYSPVLSNNRQSVIDIHRLNRNCIQSINKRQRRHSLTNKIDAVMIKHFQKTGVTPHRNYSKINSNRSESIDFIKSINLKNTNLKKRLRTNLKSVRSCSERLNWMIK